MKYIYFVALNIYNESLQIADKKFKVVKEEDGKYFFDNGRYLSYQGLYDKRHVGKRYYVYYLNLSERDEMIDSLKVFVQTYLNHDIRFAETFLEKIERNEIEVYYSKKNGFKPPQNLKKKKEVDTILF